MCLGPEHWPNRAGKLNQASDVVFLAVGDQKFPIQEVNTGYCWGDECALRVAPGEDVAAFISYADFNLPERLWREPKTLEFRPQAFPCKPK
jgi:dienelactone hydrolase